MRDPRLQRDFLAAMDIFKRNNTNNPNNTTGVTQ